MAAKPKRPSDLSQRAKFIVDISTGESTKSISQPAKRKTSAKNRKRKPREPMKK